MIISGIFANCASAQKQLYERSWSSVATGMPDEWYGSEESKKIAENVLLYQRDIGGWPKNTAFHKPLSEGVKATIKKDKDKPDAIFDNGATTTEMRFMAKMYSKTGNDIYKVSFEKGFRISSMHSMKKEADPCSFHFGKDITPILPLMMMPSSGS